MPELIRSVVSRVRVYFKERRQSPRLRVRVVFSVALRGRPNANGQTHPGPTMKGHTRDVSISGMAMLLPQVHLGGHHLAAESRELHLVLELPTGIMPLVVVPRRYEKLEEAELGCSYLLGAKIVDISDADRIRLENFITAGLKQNSNQETESLEN